MKRFKIFFYHIFIFIVGSLGIAGYFWYKIAVLPASVALAGIALLPVAVVFIGGFGILCSISFVVYILVGYVRRRR